MARELSTDIDDDDVDLPLEDDDETSFFKIDEKSKIVRHRIDDLLERRRLRSLLDEFDDLDNIDF
jgi:hypothetical protein